MDAVEEFKIYKVFKSNPETLLNNQFKVLSIAIILVRKLK